MMAAVRSKHTKPEIAVRKALHGLGYRFRLHRKDLPGKPDLVFPSRRAVIFVNGCFWHGHSCPAGALPATRREFWEDKIGKNRERDARNATALLEAGWRVLNVWECELKEPDSIERVTAWLDQFERLSRNMLPDSASTDT
jgi:DNA mismatch endonuclease (patch repair protein)